MEKTNKYWRDNEKDVMNRLGLKESLNSGAGWVQKEDGYNEYILCQLKSTEKNSISIKKRDIELLEYHASVEKKVPIFAINFVNDGSVYLLVRPEDIEGLKLSLKNEPPIVNEPINIPDINTNTNKTIIKHSTRRNEYYAEREKQYDNTKFSYVKS